MQTKPKHSWFVAQKTWETQAKHRSYFVLFHFLSKLFLLAKLVHALKLSYVRESNWKMKIEIALVEQHQCESKKRSRLVENPSVENLTTLSFS